MRAHRACNAPESPIRSLATRGTVWRVHKARESDGGYEVNPNECGDAARRMTR
jgi:hypothetical protein